MIPTTSPRRTGRRTGALLYGAPAIAEHLGLGEHQTRHLIRRGELPAFRIGRRIAARTVSLDRWLEERERAAAPLEVA